MTILTTKREATQLRLTCHAIFFDDCFDPMEGGIRGRVQEFIEEMIRRDLALESALANYDSLHRSPRASCHHPGDERRELPTPRRAQSLAQSRTHAHPRDNQGKALIAAPRQSKYRTEKKRRVDGATHWLSRAITAILALAAQTHLPRAALVGGRPFGRPLPGHAGAAVVEEQQERVVAASVRGSAIGLGRTRRGQDFDDCAERFGSPSRLGSRRRRVQR
jgi:hypothetical protein